MNALLARGFRSLPLLLLAGLPLVAYAQPGIEWEWRSRVAAPDQAEQVIPGEDGGWVILCNQFGADTSRPCASLAFLDGEGRLTRSSPLRHGAENGV